MERSIFNLGGRPAIDANVVFWIMATGTFATSADTAASLLKHFLNPWVKSELT